MQRAKLTVTTDRPRLKIQGTQTIDSNPVAKKSLDKTAPGGNYFAREAPIQTFSTGCKGFDLVLGGGWAEGRCSNVVGDKSTGKTQTAIEAAANYARKYPDPTTHKIRYKETEDAFDDGYAEVIGFPRSRVSGLDEEKLDTVNQFEKDFESWLKTIPKGGGGLYILDSLDALGSEDEQEIQYDKKTGKEKGTYGMDKAKKMSRIFRRLVRRSGRANAHLMVISQLRDKIGVSFGERSVRAGGRALDFYASQIVWLANLGKIKSTRGGFTRSVGVQIRIQAKKNKVGLPFREFDYPILFAYGIDDVQAALDWLEEAGRLSDVGLSKGKAVKQFMSDFHKMPPQQAKAERVRINKVLRKVWYEVESKFLPPQRKY